MASLTERLYARTTQGKKEDEEERKVQVGIVTNKGSNVKDTEKTSDSGKKDTSKSDSKTESKSSLTERLFARTTEGRAGGNPASPGIVSSQQNSTRRRFEDIYGELSAAEERVKGYQSEIDSWTSRYGATSDNIMDTLATKYGAQKDDSGSYIFSEQSSLDEFNRLMDELSGMYDKYNTGLSSYNDLFNQANTYDYDSARTELDALEKRLKAAKADVDNAQSAFRTGTELGAAGAEYDFLKKDYEDKQAAYNELFNQVVALNRDIKNAEFFQNSVYYNDYLSKDGIENYTGEVKHKQSEYMTEDEMRIYNYLYQQEGAQAAQEYMNYLAETLNYREGTKRGEDIRGIENDIGRFLATGGQAVQSGLDNFGRGIAQLFTEDQLDTSANQFASSYIMDDLNKTGTKIPGMDKTWGELGYEGTSVVANMLPSILVSYVAPYLGAPAAVAGALGSATMGLSAGGNAYTQALSEGYTEDMARTYGTLVGASEGALQYLLGGIGKLSGAGNLSNKALSKVASIENGLLRATAAAGVKAGGEIVEEELQNFLEPLYRSVLFNEEYDAPTVEDIVYTAVLTFLTTGVIEGGEIASYASNKPKTYGQQIKGAGSESLQALIESGLESAPDTESYALAEELNKQVQAGKTPSDWAIGKLQQANAEAIRAEATETAPETIEDAAREVVARENKIAPAEEKAATTTNDSAPYNVMSADGRTSAIIKTVQEKTGYGEYGAKAVVSIAESTGKNVETVQEAFDSAYKVGRSGMPASRVTLETSVQQAAYDAGRRDAIMAGDIENAVHTEYNGNQRTEVVTNEEVHLRNGSQWDGSANPGGQIPGLAESAGRNQSRIAQGKPADVGAASLSYGEKVSASSLGIRGGSTNATVRLVVGGDTSATKAARKLAKERGLRLVLFAGDNLNIEQTVKNADGKISKVNVSARAFVVGDRVFVRADHPRYTADQLMRHEAGHDMIAKGEIDPQTVRKRIDQTFGKEKTAQIADSYASAYEGSGLTAEEIWEEVICDSLGDMNIFSGTVNEKVSSEFIGETKKAASETKTEPVRGPPANEGKASREYWRSDLTKPQMIRLVNWVKQDIQTSTNSIGNTANWTFRNFDGMPVFAIYSTANESDPTILYEVKGAQAEYENQLITDWMGVENDGTIRNAADFSARVAAYGGKQGRDPVRRSGSVHAGNAAGNAALDGSTRGRKPSRALLNCLKNLLQKRDEAVTGKASRELDAEYMSAIESGDMKTVRSMVEDAAKAAGFTDAIPEQTLAYKTRTGKAPKKTIKVYKVFTVTPDGKPTALFVSGTSTLPQDVWLDAQDTWHFTAKNGKAYVPSTQNPYTDGGKTGGSVEIPNEEVRQELIKRGFLPEGSKAKSITALAYRPGWHAGDMPFFPQGGMKREGSNYPNIHRYNQVVFECELDADYDYTEYARNQDKAKKKDGTVNDREADLQEMPTGGYYRYATNPLTQGGDKGLWYISGSLKIGRALTQEECDSILNENGFLPQEWEQGELNLASLGYTGQLHEAARKTLAPITYDDNGNIIPLSQRFNPEVNDIRFSRDLDIEYESAVKNGDTEAAQKMVDEAASAAGYHGAYYHGSKNEFTVFSKAVGGKSNSDASVGFWFTETAEGAQKWTDEVWYGESDKGKVYKTYLQLNNPKVYETVDNKAKIDEIHNGYEAIDKEMSLYDSIYYFEDGRRYHNERYDYDKDDRRRSGISEWDAFKAIVKKYDADTVEYYLDQVPAEDREVVKRDAERYLELHKERKALEKQIGELRYSDGYELFRTDIYKLAGMSAEQANIGGTGMYMDNKGDVLKQYVDGLKSAGYDGIVIKNTSYDSDTFGEGNNQYVVFEPEQIKSADPVTYDDNGDVIPLSKRFNTDNNDIRFSREPNVEGKEISEEQQSLLQDIQSGVRDTVREELERMGKEYGWIKAGENPARDIRVPRKTDDDHYVSQTIRTVLEAGATPDAAVPTIEQMIVQGDFSYERIADKDAMAEADKTIQHKGFETAMADWLTEVNKGIVSKANTAMGWSLYNAAATKGDLKTAVSILNGMVQHQRSAAQALQATRILKKMSPDAQLYGIQRSVESLQDELVKKYGNRAPDLKIDEDLARKFLEAQTDEERAEAEAELYRDIGRQIPATFMDKWNAWRYLAMLGNPRTHVRNIVGNLGFAPVVAAKNMTAGAIESAVSFVTGGKLERTKGMVNRKLLVAAYNDYKNVAAEISAGGKYNDAAIMNQNIEDGRTIFKFKPLEKARKGNSAALEAEDIWFARPHYAFALAQYCKAHGVTVEQLQKGKALGNARAYAIKEAQKATYKDINALSHLLSGRFDERGKHGWIGKGANMVVEGILPFRKTPANILVRGIEYSPVGLLKSLTYDLYKVKTGDITAAEAIDNVAAGLTGTGLLAFGLWAAAEGLIRGAGGGDDEEKKYEELQGHQTYSLELPDGTSITLDWLAPEVLPMFIGVNLYETATEDNGDSNLDDMLNAVSNVTAPLLEMSCLQSLNDLFDNVGYATSGKSGVNALMAAVASAATSYLTQAFPTILGQVERSSQDVRMTTHIEKDSFLTSDLQYTLGKVSAKIPGWDFNQIPYIDAWGRTESSGSKAENIANNFLNPAYMSQIEISAMEEELQRLYDATGEKGVLPDRAGKKITINGTDKHLTGEEYVEYATDRGQMAYDLLTELTSLYEYDDMTDTEKVDAVKMAYEYATKVAKSNVSDYEPDSWVAKAIESEKGGGMDALDYILYKTALSMVDQPNKSGELGGTPTNAEKAAAINLRQDLSDADIASLWDTKDGYALYEAGADMRAYITKVAEGENINAEKMVGAMNTGMSDEQYYGFLDALEAHDTPTESGKYGTFTQDEAKAAIASLPNLTREQRAYLWQSMNSSWKAKNNPWK